MAIYPYFPIQFFHLAKTVGLSHANMVIYGGSMIRVDVHCPHPFASGIDVEQTRTILSPVVQGKMIHTKVERFVIICYFVFYRVFYPGVCGFEDENEKKKTTKHITLQLLGVLVGRPFARLDLGAGTGLLAALACKASFIGNEDLLIGKSSKKEVFTGY